MRHDFFEGLRFLNFSMSFFFSSRGRHTRCYRDWSSDVCSSDLHLAKSVTFYLKVDATDFAKWQHRASASYSVGGAAGPYMIGPAPKGDSLFKFVKIDDEIGRASCREGV